MPGTVIPGKVFPSEDMAPPAPRIDGAILAERRRRVAAQIAGGVCVMTGSGETLRSGDVHYPFRQDSDLLYLTGFEEPDAVAVFAPGREDGAFVLFVRPRDPDAETWTGRRAGVEGAEARFGADKAYPIGDLDRMLPELIRGHETLYYALGRNETFDKRITACLNDLRTRVRAGISAPGHIFDPRRITSEMRLFKAPEEAALMRRAAAVTREGHLAAVGAIRPGAFEYEVEAAVDGAFRRQGALGPGYPTIVGSGPNATILHYIQNDRQMRAGELVLIDAGAEFDFYNADVTRTYPVDGRYSPPGRDLVEAVNAAQRAAIDLVKPGVRFDDVHQAALRSLGAGLLDLGILSGDSEEILAKETYRPYYMHRTSHWLGMDVHAVGAYRSGDESRKLEAGMVLTVEPGLYVSPRAEAPEAFRGIGARIEDDVLVTETEHEVLTAEIPKEPAAVEELFSGLR